MPSIIIFVGNKDQKNPLSDTPETRADGKEAFSHYCVACHGMDGQNTGVPFANHISPPIPSLTSPDVQSYTDGQLKSILDNGIEPSGMPGSKGTLSDEELVVHCGIYPALAAGRQSGHPGHVYTLRYFWEVRVCEASCMQG
jgi:mono/diheme cytochrome c family protein